MIDPHARAMAAVPRVVLDTNVCLDLWLFGDPRAADLRAALHAGGVLAVTDQACREEWLRVLHYPQL
ncbi:PIN domain-containing protein, partial [Novilysobacter viscosus]|uniref:PIN domain-containing protein n=2 Tax=Novilysobacter TaxID=3382699 RepID=UPI003F880680